MGFDRGKLSALKAAKISKPGRYGDGGGLWLQVSGVGAKSWLFRYTIAGKARQMGLGSFGTITLAQAREAALEARRSVYSGIDPINAKRSTKTQALLETALAMTFKRCAGLYRHPRTKLAQPGTRPAMAKFAPGLCVSSRW